MSCAVSSAEKQKPMKVWLDWIFATIFLDYERYRAEAYGSLLVIDKKNIITGLAAAI